MKRLFLFILLFGQITDSFTQTKLNQSYNSEKQYKNQFRTSLGIGYEDGLVFLNEHPIPTFGLSYERIISKRFSVAAHILTHYRTFLNTTNLDQFPLLSKFKDSNSPFLTQAENDKLKNSGIIQISPITTIKSLSVPIDIGFIFYPLITKRHRLGLNAALSMTYDNRNYYTDQFTGVLTLKDGTQKQITLEVPTEYRNFSPGFSFKLLYDYSFKDYSLGLRVGNYNVFLIDLTKRNAQPVWETSLFLGYKF